MKHSKSWKRYLSLLLAIIMVVSLIGCAPASTPDDSANTPAVTPAPAEDIAWLNTDGTLPLVKEGTEKTLRLLVHMYDGFDTHLEEHWVYKWIEEEFNVNLEVSYFTTETRDEIVSLAFASGELPDIIIGGKLTTGEIAKYGSLEGQLVDLAPFINETNMPHLSKIYADNPEWKAEITDPDGHIYTLGLIGSESQPGNYNRFFMNWDWLEETGKEAPRTLDEFTELMRDFKNRGDDIVPIGGSYEYFSPFKYILNAFGYLLPEVNVEKGLNLGIRNGEVVLPAADREAWGEFITYMNMLYKEGLIHPDFFTMDNATVKAEMAAGQYGTFGQAPYVYVGDNYTQWWGTYPLTSDYNDTAQIAVAKSARSIGEVMITSACEEVELAAAFIDYFYKMSDDPAENSYWRSVYGPVVGSSMADLLPAEEQSYMDENGSPWRDSFGDWAGDYEYTNNKIVIWRESAIGTSLTEDYKGVIVDPDFANFLSDYENGSDSRADWWDADVQYRAACYDTGDQYLTTEVFPAIVFIDSEVQARMNEILVVLSEYAITETAKFITGARSLDELDDYFNQMDALGAKEYVQTYADYYASIQ